MFDRPALRDEQIADVLATRYGMTVTAVEYLALGHDANAWAFRASTAGPGTVFVIMRILLS